MEQVIYRALIVEDEPMVREATMRAMSANRFSCDSAANGYEGLRKFRDVRHDLVVTDLRMPDKHGHSLILELFEEPNPPQIVVLTGVADSRLIKDLLGRGVADIISKPVNYNVFATKMMLSLERECWKNTQSQNGSAQSSQSKNQIVATIEDAIDIFSECVPQAIGRVMSQGADALTDPPSTAQEFMQRLLSKQHPPKKNRRGSKRISILSTVVALPVDQNFAPLEEPFKMTSYDISETGICLIHTRAVTSEYLALCWRSVISPKRFMKAVIKVERCKPLGPFYEVAGPFAMKD